jgi:hypothetical protein
LVFTGFIVQLKLFMQFFLIIFFLCIVLYRFYRQNTNSQNALA